jgi:transcriptional regulator with GAF, ATPase, and Fis domain
VGAFKIGKVLAQRATLLLALEVSGGRIYGPAGAAALLGVKPTTLASRLKKLGIATSASENGR